MNLQPIPPHATVVQVDHLSTTVDVLLDIILKVYPDPNNAPPDVFEAVARAERARGVAAIEGATVELWKRDIERPPGDIAISLERHHQIRNRGFTLQHDRSHDGEELLEAALYLLTGPDSKFAHWPWPETRIHVDTDYDGDRRLAVAGALIAAEYDRLAP